MTFQITARAAAGRMGRFSTRHGDVTTPTLMPVVNPNIDLVSPQEMRDRFGCEMVITNSYVFWKHEALRTAALENGVHSVLDWDGPVMTDSGTFQMYVYGDVEVGPEEIVAFQRDMGVDVATCLDLFVTPDMNRQQAEEAVATTLARTKEAVAHKGESLLNATVQGGLELDLRQHCATTYRDLDVDYHTIGGVVPVMERQMYPELVDMILASQGTLRKDRPLHLFGAGHPLVFPLAVALGCDLFDSSSYAKYAKDGRVMTPEGTVKAAELEEWPTASRDLDAWTPRELAKELGITGGSSKKKRGRRGPPRTEAGKAAERALALHNLDVMFTDLRRIRQSIRDGTLWELVEQRAAAHPLLAAATRKLGDPVYQQWLERREPATGERALRYTGSLTHRRPIFHRIRERVQTYVTPVAEPIELDESQAGPYGEAGDLRRELGLHKEPESKPYGARLGPLEAEMDHAVISPLGPVPLGLDEAYPFSQSVLPRLEGLDREHMGWVGETKDLFLEAHDFTPTIPGPPGPDGPPDAARLQVLRTADWQFGQGAGAVLAGYGSPEEVHAALTDPDAPSVADLVARGPHEGTTWKAEHSPRTEKLRLVHRDGEHVLSLRAGDAHFTLKEPGARLLHAALPAPALRVVVHDDSVPFNRDGKSVFAQFVLGADPALRPGDECLVVDQQDRLVAVGRALLNDEEMADFQGGMAVKVREGLAADNVA
ncbi:MAG: tRNA guanosine(15) transglycosylase TgtA [Thermoplasmatota archaeon]